ncbi:TonB-dependent receptor [Novosphingobium cyanobacteriorum]|uniref:TonB-dependent receptor n=1 Tax=Novosphingobium cyanobacteriorum TaxID=3024215 RepID=A0ABT6CJ33_9SPHN|nr:TonB-dependent receptor [Novosphingobium cyanobacteriorum]MDF8333811.1 TonB-dependent receptor [Novosphingobium cyanobacteriorum]
MKGHVSGPISDTLSYRVSAQTTQAGDWQKSATRDATLGQTSFYQGRVQVLWQPSETMRFTVMANAWQDRSDTQAGQVNALVPQNPLNVDATAALLAQPVTVGRNNRIADWDPGVDYRNNNRFYQFALRGEVDLTQTITLTSITSYSNYRQRENRDIDGTPLQVLLVTPYGDLESFSQELRLTGHSGPVKWIVGGNYSRDIGTEFQRYAIRQQTNNAPVGIPLLLADLTTDTRARTYAAFANADFELTSALTATGAIRYTRSNRNFTGCMRDSGDGALAGTLAVIQFVAKGALGLPPGPVPLPGNCATLDDNYDAGLTNDRLSESNVSWRTGLKFAPDRDFMVYANVSRGYKSGQFPTILASRSFSFQPVTQEKLTAYEVGTKISLADHKVDVSAAAFYYDYRNKQVRGRYLDPIFFTLEKLDNVPKSDVAGGEIQISMRPAQGLTVNLAGSYTDAKIRKYVGIDQLGASVDFANTQIPFTSKWQAVADADYRIPVGADHEISIGSTLTYTGKSNAFLGADPVGALKGRTLLDLRAGYGAQDGSWQVFAWGRNVTEARYQNFILRVTDTVIGYAGRPATYGVTLTTKFK